MCDLEAGVEVPVQPLHDEQHGDAGAVGVGVVDDRAVQVHQPLVFGQRPAGGRRQWQRTGEATLTQPHSSGSLQRLAAAPGAASDRRRPNLTLEALLHLMVLCVLTSLEVTQGHLDKY